MDNNKKRKRIFNTKAVYAALGVASMTAAPLAIISCGSAAGNIHKPDPILYSEIGSHFGGEKNNYIEGVKPISIDGATYSNFHFGQEMDAFSGYSKASEVQSPATSGLLQNYMIRSSTGYPMYPSIEYKSAWNWNPNGVDMRSTAAQAKARATKFDNDHSDAFKRMQLYSAYNATATAAGQTPEVLSKFGGEHDMFWEPADWRFTRATVRDIAPSAYGAKLKPTQSTYGMFSFFTSTAGNAPTKEGLLDKGDSYTVNDFWSYIRFFPVGGTGLSNVQIPDGQAIDAAHRNGTVSLGNINWTEDVERAVGISKDASGHFAYARGLANMADFYGFDGWVFDTENARGYQDQSINEAFWKDYLYYARDLNKYPTAWSGISEKEYKKFHYTHRPQTLVNYEGQGGDGYNDFHYTFQRHGLGVADHSDDVKQARSNPADIHPPAFYDSSKYQTGTGDVNYAGVPLADEYSSQLYKYSEGYNPGQEGLGLAATEISARKAVEISRILHSYKSPSDVPEELKEYMYENRQSIWFWLYSNENFKELSKAYSSRVGDPRYSPLIKETSLMAAGKSSLSDAFQEKSSIVGRGPWSTTFGRGLGTNFNLWGGKDISKYVHHGEEGWKTYVGQTALPTYRWIVDEYDQNGKLLTNPQDLNDEGAVKRSVEPDVASQNDLNWMWGSHLTYNGEIKDRGGSFENKLYTSNIPVKTGDKFSIKVRNNDLVPDLALWTADGEVPVYSPNPGEGAEAPTQTPWGDPLSNRGLLKHVNESVWKVERSKHIVKPESMKDLGNSGWTEITYDLSKFNRKTIMDFGIKVTASKDHEQLTDRLRVGEMKFMPKGYSPTADEYKVNISNVKTEFAWDKATSINARISWDADKRVRTYLTFLSNDNGDLLNLMWVGSNQAAFLDNVPKSDNPKIMIIGLNDANDIVTSSKITLDLGIGGNHA